MNLKLLFAGALCTLLWTVPIVSEAQPAITQLKPRDIYVKPFPPFRIVGNLY